MTNKQFKAIHNLLAYIYTRNKNSRTLKGRTQLNTQVQSVITDHIRDEYLTYKLNGLPPKSYKLQLIFAFLQDMMTVTENNNNNFL